MPTTSPDDLPPSPRRRASRRPRPDAAPVAGDAARRRRSRAATGAASPATAAGRDGDSTEVLPTIELTSVLEAGDDVSPAIDRLATLRGATLAALVGVRRSPHGFALTHAVPVGSVRLAELRRATPLRSGHVVAVLLAVAQALVVLHDAGLAHGAVDADHLLVAQDGSVVLAGSGLAWSGAPGTSNGPTPDDDVVACAGLIRNLLGSGTASSGLVLVGLRAGDPDPALRPDAAALLESVRRCGPEASLLDLLWLTDDGPRPSTSTPPAVPFVEPRRDVAGADAASAGAATRSRATTAAHEVVGDSAAPQVVREPVEWDGSGSDRRPPGGASARRADLPRRAPRSRAVRPVAVVAVVVSCALMVAGGLALRASGGVAAASETGSGSPSARAIAAQESAYASQAPGAGPSVGPTASVPTASAAVAVASSAASSGPSASMTGPLAGLDSPAPSGSATHVLDPSVLDVDRGAAPAPDWSTVLRGLDAGRLRAIAAGSVAQLAEHVDPAGPAFLADSRLVARVLASGATLRGGALQVQAVQRLRSTPDRLELRVRDRRAAYSIEIDGERSTVAARAPRWWQVTLVRGGDGRWRIYEVTASARAGA